MALHLKKLCVGVETLDDIRSWQDRRKFNVAGSPDGQMVVAHLTRNMPRRADEVLDGGSLYWVVKGRIICRNAIVGLEAVDDTAREKGSGGSRSRSKCAILLAAGPIPTVAQAHRPFQGWRYLEASDVPADAADAGEGVGGSSDGMPPEMAAELRDLGLLG